MIATRRTLFVSAGALLAAAVVILPAGTGRAAERVPLLSYDFTGLGAASAPLASDAAATAPLAVAVQASAQLDPASVTCIAKVVHHEARNQPRSGQIAVAQTLIHRLKGGNGRFGSTICEIANQPGQFFNVAGYRPHQDETWNAALDVARDALSGGEDDVAPGAMFFRAAYAQPSSFFRTRQRITTVGDQVFYR